jgi:hypothetical protein
VELFEEIRREYEFGVGTIVGVAKKLGVHRRMVREAVAHALPARRKPTVRRAWKMDALKGFIDATLETDRKAPRKQRLCVVKTQLMFKIDGLHSRPVVAEGTVAAC